jgi:hypothetical protein
MCLHCRRWYRIVETANEEKIFTVIGFRGKRFVSMADVQQHNSKNSNMGQI